MNTQEKIEMIIQNHEICEYAFGKVDSLHISRELWNIGAEDSARYGYSWALPPYCGDIDSNMQKCREYTSFCVYLTVHETANSWDLSIYFQIKQAHEDLTRRVRKDLKDEDLESYVLSTGCSACEQCACPDEPCRHPEECLPSIESHGIMVMQAAEELGMTLNFGSDSMTCLGMILFD